ncbi:unnamed protein product [Zymoseptoria tritici ST99CH_1E4]|uniref:alpha-amylase n=1 Tax=Zymoseptoria tritici ST99CH_1E4 TaxID=1276532 RepID=A0A2H1GNB9_ZYMTR|nr:unnamed protein product [Zymoseptoria tritici ST99CH_1E4]
MAQLSSLLCILFAFFTLGNCLTPAEWRSQSIYQVMTDRFARTDGSTTAPCRLDDYCGGTWQGLISKLSYIQQMGFTAIWISPVVQNVQGLTADGNSYHGYWQNNPYALNRKFGTADDLKALSAEVHRRGMYLMVDVAPNHMASISTRANVDYSKLSPFNDKSYYHTPPCGIDYNNVTSIRKCWIGSDTVSLPDLRTEDARVQNLWNTWVSQLVSNYSIDGLRIDTAQQVNPEFWPSFHAAAGGLHMIGEVWQGSPDVMCPYQNSLPGLMNYGAYYWIIQAFQRSTGSMANLANGMAWMKAVCRDTTLLGSFIENHDLPRYASMTNDVARIQNAIAFTMLMDGIPIIYQGQEQRFGGHDVPAQREHLWQSGYDKNAVLYKFIRTMNLIRQRAIQRDGSHATTKASPISNDANTIVVRKGTAGKQIISVYTNRGSGWSGVVNVKGTAAGFGAFQKLINVVNCRPFTTNRTGDVAVSLVAGMPAVLYPVTEMTGSGICGY